MAGYLKGRLPEVLKAVGPLLFGMSIEPEKEILLTLTRSDQVDTVLAEIVRAAELNDTGRGIAFVLPVDRVVGVAHFMKHSP